MERSFRFDQIDFIRHSHRLSYLRCGDRCGQCSAISLYILLNIYESENYSSVILPAKAFELAETYAKMLKATRYPMTWTPTAMGQVSNLRETISKLDKTFNRANPAGDCISNFNGFGSGIYYASCLTGNQPTKNAGELFFKNISDANYFSMNNRHFEMNHVGVIVWSPVSIFIFDPNIGGHLFDINKLSPAIIDELIGGMYSRVTNRYAKRTLIGTRIMAVVKPNILAYSNIIHGMSEALHPKPYSRKRPRAGSESRDSSESHSMSELKTHFQQFSLRDCDEQSQFHPESHSTFELRTRFKQLSLRERDEQPQIKKRKFER
jgi:hypothetical protein